MKHLLSPSGKHRQSGAALVVGLILLIVITLMAVSSMNTATLDLIMAGNEQYRSRAFVAAEIGIEQALSKGVYDTSKDDPGPTSPVSTGSGGDKYTYTITRPTGGTADDAPPMNSEGKFRAIYFRIQSKGISDRNTQTSTTQELFQVVNAPDDIGYNQSVCAGTSDLEGASC